MTEITRKQTALIHIANTQCGITADVHMAHVVEFGSGLDEWTASSKYLSYEQAEKLIAHLTEAHGFKKKTRKREGEVYYHKASLQGLRNEIAEYARRRFGDGWEKPLMALASKITHQEIDRLEWIMNYYHLKEIKEALLRLEAAGPYVPREERKRGYAPGPGDPF